MAKLRCHFCGNVWEQQVTDSFHCYECTMWSAPLSVIEINNEEINQLWNELNIKLNPTIKDLLSSINSVLYRVKTRENFLDDIHFLPLIYDRIVISDVWLTLTPDDYDSFLLYLDEGIYIPCLTPFNINYINGVKSNNDPFRDMGDLGKAISEKGLFIEFLHYLPFNDRIPFLIAFSNLASVLTYLDLNHPNFNKEIVKKSLIAEGMYPNINFAVDIINSIFITSQLLDLPLILNRNYEAVFYNKFSSTHFQSTSDITNLVRKFLTDIKIDIPKRVSVKDILQFRKSDKAIEFRNFLAKMTNEARTDASLPYEYELLSEFQKRVQRFNEESRKFGDTQIAILSGLASTLGAFFAGPFGAIASGIGSTGVALLAKLLYSKIYERNHADWAVIFNKWSER